MKQLPYFLIVIILFFSLPGCSTSKGSLFKDTHESDKRKDHSPALSDDDDPYYPEDDEYEKAEGLYVTSSPYGATVYLDNKYYGTTPLWIPDIKTGNYMLAITYPGYYSHNDWIYYPGGYIKYNATLKPVTGYLDLSVSPQDASISFNDRIISRGITELRVGTYELHVRKFGYKDAYRTVTIDEKTTTSVTVVLEEASFSLSNPGVSRKIFNPMNPGTLGNTEISFYVTSSGNGTLAVIDKNGSEVYSRTFPMFQTWYQYCTWNGKTQNGVICPDGEYTISIKAIAEKDGEIHSLYTTVRIDRSITISYRSMWNGVTGLMYVSTPDVLPGSSFQISTLFSAHIETYNGQLLMRAPSQLSVRFGPGSSTEVDILATIILIDADFFPYSISAAVKYQTLKTRGTINIQSALYAKATFHYGTGADTLSNFTGLSLGVPFQAAAGYFSLILSPEIIISPFKVTYAPDYDKDIALTVWGYGRCGIMFDPGTIITGISCAIRTTPFGGKEAFGIHYPLLGAYELHMMVPDSSLFLSCIAGTEFESADNFYIMGGFGVGFIY
ncbi:MAG: PEGA domain-containing protein [Spirochaetales bacterium]|nr:PEGA domain-containing protein [Spirochaetales bacterium]